MLRLHCLHRLSLAAVSRGCSSLWCAYFSLWRLLSLPRVDSRHAGFRSCSMWAPEHRLSSCGAWAQLTLGMWNPPEPGFEPVSPALAGRLWTTGSSRKSTFSFFDSTELAIACFFPQPQLILRMVCMFCHVYFYVLKFIRFFFSSFCIWVLQRPTPLCLCVLC